MSYFCLMLPLQLVFVSTGLFLVCLYFVFVFIDMHFFYLFVEDAFFVCLHCFYLNRMMHTELTVHRKN